MGFCAKHIAEANAAAEAKSVFLILCLVLGLGFYRLGFVCKYSEKNVKERRKERGNLPDKLFFVWNEFFQRYIWKCREKIVTLQSFPLPKIGNRKTNRNPNW